MTAPELPAVRDADAMPDTADLVLYPQLSDAQRQTIAEFGDRREYRAGDWLFDRGDRDAPLVLIEAGTVDILDRRHDGDVRIARGTPGVFLGDLAMFTGQPTIAAGRAAEPTTALVVSPDKLRVLLAEHGDLSEMILKSFTARRDWLVAKGYGLTSLVGPARCQHTYRLRMFLARNQVPFRWLDSETDPTARELLERVGASVDDSPVLVCGSSDHVARKPSVEEVADHLGLRPEPGDEPYDLVVVGAGPAGLAAAVYGASEGLRTLVLDAESPGGQAGTSSKIENYLGFLTGISGAELARQATLQARKFGAVLSNPRRGCRLHPGDREHELELDDGRRIKARCVLVATGAEYRKLDCPNCGDFEGRGVYYAASHVEAVNCAERELAVVGGGNSAGQAVCFLASKAKKVYFAIRHATLEETRMSRYLSDRVGKLANVEVLPNCEVKSLSGDGVLEGVEFHTDGEAKQVDVAGLFVLIGADPRTDWLEGTVLCDEHGFVLAGDELRHDRRYESTWKLERDPYLLETCVPGVFVAGDARCGSVKRVAAAVGEGAMSVTLAHRRLAELGDEG